MSDAASKVVNLPRTEANRVTIFGKIVNVKPLEKDGKSTGYATRLSLPAADKYSNTQTVEVVTGQKLGAKGEEITVECEIRGYIQRNTNKETGEEFEYSRIWLKVVE
jgi:hypothetical protein